MAQYGYLAHHGILGQKWGIRRYQNADGSLTAEGQRRYGVYSSHKKTADKFNSMTKQMEKSKELRKDPKFMKEYEKAGSNWEKAMKAYATDKDYRKSVKSGKNIANSMANKITDTTLKGQNIASSKEKERYSKVAKSYEKRNGDYRWPKSKQDAIDVIRYDRDKCQKSGSSLGGSFLESINGFNKTVQPVKHFSDKKGKIALSYCRVPGYGDVYVKGSGNMNDLNLNELFKKPPKDKNIASYSNETSTDREKRAAAYDRTAEGLKKARERMVYNQLTFI